MRRQSTKVGMGAGVVRRHRPNYMIALGIGLLLMLGLVLMYAIGPQRANLLNFATGANYSDNFFFNKQLASVLISVVAFGFFAIIPHRWFTAKYAKHIFWTGLISCVLLVFCGAVLNLPFASDTNGAYRWFYLGGLGSFQPSELLKFGTLLFVGGFLGMRISQGKLNDVQETLVPLAIAIGASLFVVVVLQKDLGTGISLMAIVMAMLVGSGMNGKLLMKIIGALLVVGVIFTISAPHRMERVMTFLQGDNNSQTADADSYHIQQARIAIGSGGLFGLGIGQSVQATGYLPEAINDSIFAIIGETFGLVGAVAVLTLFAALLMILLKVASRLADMKLRLIVIGVFGWVAAHVILNVAAMTGLAPLTGIPLPLLSYGGTSMLFIAAALGLAFQLSSYTSHKPLTEEGGANGAHSGGRRWLGRTRYARGRSL